MRKSMENMLEFDHYQVRNILPAKTSPLVKPI